MGLVFRLDLMDTADGGSASGTPRELSGLAEECKSAACRSALKKVDKTAELLQGIMPVVVVRGNDSDSAASRGKRDEVAFLADGRETVSVPLDRIARAESAVALAMESVEHLVGSRSPAYESLRREALRKAVESSADMKSKSASKDKAAANERTTAKEKTTTKKEPAVITLTDSNFEKEVMGDSENVWFVKFHAPWCGHCQALQPTWTELGQAMKGKAKIAKVDATTQKRLAQEFKIQGFPTLILFPGGPKSKAKIQPYNGPREIGPLTSFVTKYASAMIKPEQLLSNEEFEKECVGPAHICVVAFVPHIYDTTAKDRQRLLKILRSVMVQDSVSSLPIKKFYWISAGQSFELEHALQLEFGWPALTLFNKHKNVYAIHRGKFDKDDITAFVTSHLAGHGRNYAPLPSNVPAWPKSDKWDRKDAKPPQEEL